MGRCRGTLWAEVTNQLMLQGRPCPIGNRKEPASALPSGKQQTYSNAIFYLQNSTNMHSSGSNQSRAMRDYWHANADGLRLPLLTAFLTRTLLAWPIQAIFALAVHHCCFNYIIEHDDAIASSDAGFRVPKSAWQRAAAAAAGAPPGEHARV